MRQKICDYKTLVTDNDLIAKVDSLYKTQIDKYANIRKELKQFFIKNKFENENQSINSSAVMSISQQTVNSSKKSLFKVSNLTEKQNEIEKATFLAEQSKTRFENQMKILELQKSLELEEEKQKHFEKVLEAERNLKFVELDERLEETYFDKNSSKIDLPSENSVDKVSKFLKDEQSHQNIKNDYLMQLTFRNENPDRNFISTNNIPQKHFQQFPTYEKAKTLRENKTFTVSDNKNESLL